MCRPPCRPCRNRSPVTWRCYLASGCSWRKLWMQREEEIPLIHLSRLDRLLCTRPPPKTSQTAAPLTCLRKWRVYVVNTKQSIKTVLDFIDGGLEHVWGHCLTNFVFTETDNLNMFSLSCPLPWNVITKPLSPSLAIRKSFFISFFFIAAAVSSMWIDKKPRACWLQTRKMEASSSARQLWPRTTLWPWDNRPPGLEIL